jgi:hypothetical protein
MKYSLIAVAAVLLLGGGVWLFLGNHGTEQLKKEDSGILLYVESGDVSYRNTEQGAFMKATSSPIAIANDSFVYTGKGKATILFPNNSNVSLDEYTELRVHYDSQKTTIFQTLGTTYHRVEALVTGATYEVETPGTVASVRGTRFAVKFDKTTKVTKVAVTEHKVLVSKFEDVTANGTTTRKTLASAEVSEGSTAKVEVKTSTSSIDIVSTDKEADMKTWVEENKTRDEVQMKIKEENPVSGDARSELKAVLENRNENVDTGKKENPPASDTSAPETKKDEPKPATKEIAPSPTPVKTEPADSGIETKPATSPVVTPLIKKLDYETFFDKFNDLFFTYFYLDDADAPCTKNVSGSARVAAVTTYATENGYPFTSKTLLDFSQAIDAYCAKKDPSVKARLQARFDVEYPFQD